EQLGLVAGVADLAGKHHAPGIRGMHTANQAQQGRLAAPRASQHGCDFASRKTQRKVAENGAPAVIAECDVINFDERSFVHVACGLGKPSLSHAMNTLPGSGRCPGNSPGQAVWISGPVPLWKAGYPAPRVQRGRSEKPIRNSSTARAAWRPSRIAQTTSD